MLAGITPVSHLAPHSTSQAPGDQPPVLRADRDGIATLTLNTPRTRNALSMAMMAALAAELERVGDDRAIRVVVLAAAGPAFSAGHDLKELRSRRDPDFHRRVFDLGAALALRLAGLRQPVIARVQGTAAAAGCQLVASCDLAVAGESARFATPGINAGLFCATPMVALTRGVGRKAAMEMLLTGGLIDAREALRIGLINRVVPDDRLDDAVDTLARTIASKSPAAIALGKRGFYQQVDTDLETAYARMVTVMTENMQLEDCGEGIDAFIEKRPPVWRGV